MDLQSPVPICKNHFIKFSCVILTAVLIAISNGEAVLAPKPIVTQFNDPKPAETILSDNLTENPSVVLPNVLLAIARCESGDRQFNEDGTVVRGRINPYDIGRFQINLLYHQAEAEKLGLNLYTYNGNTKYAIYLYRKYGTKPWNWSRECWASKNH